MSKYVFYPHMRRFHTRLVRGTCTSYEGIKRKYNHKKNGSQSSRFSYDICPLRILIGNKFFDFCGNDKEVRFFFDDTTFAEAFDSYSGTFLNEWEKFFIPGFHIEVFRNSLFFTFCLGPRMLSQKFIYFSTFKILRL